MALLNEKKIGHNHGMETAKKPNTVRVLMFDVSLPWASFWYDVSNVVLFIGAFAVAAGTYGSIKMGSVKERFSDERISANEAETKRAVADSDIAKKSAVEANLFLEREKIARLKLEVRVGPRTLSLGQDGQNKITESLKGFEKQTGIIKASPPFPESEMFARVLAAPLRAAGWDIVPMQGDNSNNIIAPTGVIIRYSTIWTAENKWVPTGSPAAEKLAELLNGFGIEASAMPALNPPITGSNTMEIIISTK